MNPLDVLRFGQGEIDPLIDRLRPADWDAIALGVWTAKDLVGHLGAFETRFAEILTLFVGGTPATSLHQSDPGTFNDDQAAVRRDWTREAIVAELRDAHRVVMSLVPRISPQRWREVGTIAWYGPEYSLDDLVVYQMYGHKREHAPQLEAVVQRSGS